MKIKTGIDLVYLPRFEKALERGGSVFLKRVYFESELKDQGIERLAGIFAAKEAVMKALNLPKDSWHSIKITYSQSGTPKVQILNLKSSIVNHSLSISHDGNYVIAQFVALL